MSSEQRARGRAPELEDEQREQLQDARVARFGDRQRAHVPRAHTQRVRRAARRRRRRRRRRATRGRLQTARARKCILRAAIGEL